MILQRAIFRLPAINFGGCNACDMKSNCDVSFWQLLVTIDVVSFLHIATFSHFFTRFASHDFRPGCHCIVCQVAVAAQLLRKTCESLGCEVINIKLGKTQQPALFFLDFPCVFSCFIFIMGNLDFLCLFSGEIWCFKGYIGVAGYSKVSFTKSRSDFWYRWCPPQWKLRWQSQIDWRFVLLPSRHRAIRIILHNYAYSNSWNQLL